MSKTIVACIIAALLLTACGSPEERAVEYLARAQDSFDQGNFVQAKLEARNAVQIQPKNAKARYLLGLLAERDQEYRAMFGHLTVAVDTDPKFLEALVKLGDMYLSAQVPDKAVELAQQALEIAPDDTAVILLNARLLRQQHKLEEAMLEIERVLTLDADNPRAILLKSAIFSNTDADLALEILSAGIQNLDKDDGKPLRRMQLKILEREKRLEDLEAGYLALIQSFPDELLYQYELATVYAGQDRVDEAEAVLRKLVEASPLNEEGRLGLVKFLGETKGRGAAEQALGEFLADSPDSYKLRNSLGDLYLASDRVEEAMEMFHMIVEQAPLSDEGLLARNRIAADKIREDDIVGARTLLDGILADEPDNGDALVLRASLDVADQRYDDAIADLRLAIRKNPDDSHQALLLMARTYAQKGDNALAEDTYRKLLELDLVHPAGIRELSILVAMKGDPDQAQQLLERRLESVPDDVQTAAGLLKLLRAKDDLKGAERVARRLVEASDRPGVPDVFLAGVLESRKMYVEAINIYQRVLDETPEATQALDGMVRSMVAIGKEDEVLDYLRSYVGNHPQNNVAKFMLGIQYASIGEINQARALYEEVIVADPELPTVYLGLAQLYPDDDERRIAALERGLLAIPGDINLTLVLAIDYEAAGRIDDMITYYSEALRVHPDSDVVANNLAAALLNDPSDNTRIQRALQIASRFSESNTSAFIDTLGWAYYRAGEYPSAVVYLERAVAAADEVPVLRYHLGMAHAAANNPQDAMRELKKAISLAKTDFAGMDEAMATLESLENKPAG